MAYDLDAAIDRWVDQQIALLPPMTPDDFSRAAAILASARPAAREAA